MKTYSEISQAIPQEQANDNTRAFFDKATGDYLDIVTNSSWHAWLTRPRGRRESPIPTSA